MSKPKIVSIIDKIKQLKSANCFSDWEFDTVSDIITVPNKTVKQELLVESIIVNAQQRYKCIPHYNNLKQKGILNNWEYTFMKDLLFKNPSYLSDKQIEIRNKIKKKIDKYKTRTEGEIIGKKPNKDKSNIHD